MGDERRRDYRLVGDTAKCPACGVPMDPGAYRCPRCLIYFCFKCRRRVQQNHPQFQCMNQQCDQYGKMLCNACIVQVPVMRDRSWQELVEPSRQELVEAEKASYWAPALPGGCAGVAFAILAGGIFAAGLYLAFTWYIGAMYIGAIAGMVVGGSVALWLKRLGEQIPPVAAVYRTVPAVYKTVTKTVEVGRSKFCFACRQAVQHL